MATKKKAPTTRRATKPTEAQAAPQTPAETPAPPVQIADAHDVLNALPIGALIERLPVGWRVSLDRTGTQSGTADSVGKAFRLIGSTRAWVNDTFVTLSRDGDVIS